MSARAFCSLRRLIRERRRRIPSQKRKSIRATHGRAANRATTMKASEEAKADSARSRSPPSGEKAAESEHPESIAAAIIDKTRRKCMTPPFASVRNIAEGEEMATIALLWAFCYVEFMTKPTSENSLYGQSGYPAVEKLIDTEDFTELNTTFEVAYGELMELSKRKKGLKTQRDAKRAMRSLELTMELLRELLAIKYRIQEEAEGKAKKGH